MRVAVAGAGGRMGRTLIDAVLADRDLALAAALDAAGSPALGQPAGNLRIGSDLGALAGAEVLVDFTRPEGTLAHLAACLQHGKPMVIGTTGFSDVQKARIAEGARRLPIVFSPNFAIGVNVVFRLAQTAAAALGDAYDVEIVEAHHRFKKDAPSGTALALGRAITDALKRDLDKVGVCGRKGIVGERTKKEIGLLSVRAGDIAGDHTVIFGGLGERLEFVHRAHSRETFARGALRAAQWLVKQKKGLYSMQDVLGL